MNKKKSIKIIAIFISLLVVSLPMIAAQELNLQVDANGNLVTGDSFYREFNELNQLVRVREGNTSNDPILFEYIWHPLQERILVKDVFKNGVYNYSIYYVNENYIHIENSSGNYSEKYVYMDDQLVAFVDTDGNKRFVHSDHIGSVSLVTDIDGNIVEETYYSPHGKALEGGKESRFDYEGKEYDEVTGRLDFGFRQFNPDIPVWDIPDTLIPDVYNSQALNRHMFEFGNPHKYQDETGNTPILAVMAVGAVIGAAVNTGVYYLSDPNPTLQGAKGYAVAGAAQGALSVLGPLGAFVGGASRETIEQAFEGELNTESADDIIISGGVSALTLGLGKSKLLGIGGKRLLPNEALYKIKYPSSLLTTKTGQIFIANSFVKDLGSGLGPLAGNYLRTLQIQNNYFRYQSYFSDKADESSSSSGSRGSRGGGGGGCRCGTWGDLREEAENAAPGETAGDIIRRWRNK